MKYDVIVSHANDDFVWNVFERATEQVVNTFYFEDDAIDYADFLEEGGAFDGFTPSFMLNAIPIRDTNIAFENLISE